MPYDRELADRIRMVLAEEVLGGELDDDAGDLGLVAEKKMFGGLGFMVAGHLAVCAGSQADLMVRVDPADLDALCAAPGVEPMAMAGRTSKSWVRVAPTALDADALTAWVARGSPPPATPRAADRPREVAHPELGPLRSGKRDLSREVAHPELGCPETGKRDLSREVGGRHQLTARERSFTRR